MIESDGPSGVETQRVTPVFSLGVVHEPSAGMDEPSKTRGVEFDLVLATLRRPVAASAGIAFGLWAVVTIAVGDSRIGLGSALLVVLAAAVRSVDRQVGFSFGEGFVGYRADPRWPQGVQEDDDVQWNWRSGALEEDEVRPSASPARA